MDSPKKKAKLGPTVAVAEEIKEKEEFEPEPALVEALLHHIQSVVSADPQMKEGRIPLKVAPTRDGFYVKSTHEGRSTFCGPRVTYENCHELLEYIAANKAPEPSYQHLEPVVPVPEAYLAPGYWIELTLYTNRIHYRLRKILREICQARPGYRVLLAQFSRDATATYPHMLRISLRAPDVVVGILGNVMTIADFMFLEIAQVLERTARSDLELLLGDFGPAILGKYSLQSLSHGKKRVVFDSGLKNGRLYTASFSIPAVKSMFLAQAPLGHTSEIPASLSDALYAYVLDRYASMLSTDTYFKHEQSQYDDIKFRDGEGPVPTAENLHAIWQCLRTSPLEDVENPVSAKYFLTIHYGVKRFKPHLMELLSSEFMRGLPCSLSELEKCIEDDGVKLKQGLYVVVYTDSFHSQVAFLPPRTVSLRDYMIAFTIIRLRNDRINIPLVSHTVKWFLETYDKSLQKPRCTDLGEMLEISGCDQDGDKVACLCF